MLLAKRHLLTSVYQTVLTVYALGVFETSTFGGSGRWGAFSRISLQIRVLEPGLKRRNSLIAVNVWAIS